MGESLMTVKEVAAMLRVSPQTLYELLERRDIPAVRIRSQWRFEPNRIRSWIRECGAPSASSKRR